jgi:CRP-like cAMP-binding protein
MISAERLLAIAAWARELSPEEIDKARRGVTEKSYPKDSYVLHHGDQNDCWHGVVSGILRLGLVSRKGKVATLAGLRGGAWFGEGTIIKGEPRRYDLVALRDSRIAIMNRQTFFWLFEHSAAFNRYLVRQFNERLGQFIALAEYDRILDAPARLARNLAWLFNPQLYPDGGMRLEITQEEIGLLAGMSRQVANQVLGVLEKEGLITVERSAILIRDVERLARYGG